MAVADVRFQGVIDEIRNICVDYFHDVRPSAFFLSHCHTDHMVGLDSRELADYLSQTESPIYCSRLTATILEQWEKYHHVSSSLRPLDINHSNLVNVPGAGAVFVTLIPSGHCPGSVMFLFECSAGTILYTGDFRYAVGDALKLKTLRQNPSDSGSDLKYIDHLYLDCTFCDNRASNLPSRERISAEMCAEVSDWIQRGSGYRVLISPAGRFGAEFLFVELHRKIGLKIHVTPEMYRIYSNIPELLRCITINPDESAIHSCSLRIRGKVTIPRCLQGNIHVRTVIPTTQWHIMNASANLITRQENTSRVFYSMHSSLEEIRDFVNCVQPAKVTPIAKPDSVTREEIQQLLACPVQFPVTSKASADPLYSQ